MVNDTSENEERFDGCVDGVPQPAVRWIVYNAFTNVELAALSNVSRRWREIVAQCVVGAVILEDDERISRAQPPPLTFTRLLLPSLIRNIYTSYSNFPSPQPGGQKKPKKEEYEETYCVAWFHPDGIRFKQILQNPSPEMCEEGGQQEYEIAPMHLETTVRKLGTDEVIGIHTGDQKSIVTKIDSRLNQTIAASKLHVSSPAEDNMMNQWSSILYQWDGYSEAIDVLQPFGYSRSLLQVSELEE